MQQEAIEVGMCRAPIANTSRVPSTNTVVAQDAMEKYTVEKVCLSSYSVTGRHKFGIADTITGDCSPHQAHGASKYGHMLAFFTN